MTGFYRCNRVFKLWLSKDPFFWTELCTSSYYDNLDLEYTLTDFSWGS